MVVIRLDRPETNLEAIAAVGSNIFQKILENKQKIQRQKQLQQLISGAEKEGREVTTTFRPGGGISGVSIKSLEATTPGFFDTGTQAVTVPSAQPTITPQAIRAAIPGSRAIPPTTQTITPSAALAPRAPGLAPSPIAPTLPGQQRLESVTEKRITPTGVQTGKFERVPTTQEIQKETAQKAAGAAATQGAKAAQKAEVGVLRASIASDTAFNEVVRFNRVQFDKFGVRPGDFLGLFDKFTPEQINEFKAAAVGAGREAAATVGMQIIPAARAVRMVDIFAKSSAKVGLTIEGNANNVGASMGNAFGNALAANISIPMQDGTDKKIQDVTIDKKTGLPLSQLNFSERLRAFTDITQDFRNKTASNYILNIFERDPELLQPDFRQKLETAIEMEDEQGERALVDPVTKEIILEL